MAEKTIQGKAESKHWKRDATLKDLLGLLDEIEKSNKTPEEKAKLTQRVVDYGQFLSQQIYEGKRQLDPSDDNETIKKFNIRMYSTYYTKGESSYEEAQRPTGYFDEKREFVKDSYEGENPGTRNHKNPRWHPIPLREETEVVIPPLVDSKHVTKPNGGQTGGVVVGPHQRGTGQAAKLYSNGNGAFGGVVPPLQGASFVGKDFGNATNLKDFEPKEGLVSDSNVAENISDEKKDNKRRRRIPLWLLPPLVTGAVVLGDKGESKPQTLPDPQPEPIPEVVVPTPEDAYLTYTVATGRARANKQFGEQGAEIYDNFVEAIKKGKLPKPMADLAKKYQMSKMVHDGYGYDFDRAEIEATSWLMMSQTYEANRKDIQKVIRLMSDSESKNETKAASATEQLKKAISPSGEIRLKKAFSMAHAAAVKYGVDPRSNQVATVDYGPYGASKQTGPSIRHFSDEEKTTYMGLVNDALHNGKHYAPDR